jgi:hypothetical protein
MAGGAAIGAAGTAAAAPVVHAHVTTNRWCYGDDWRCFDNDGFRFNHGFDNGGFRFNHHFDDGGFRFGHRFDDGGFRFGHRFDDGSVVIILR